MVQFLAGMIEQNAHISIENGQALYRKYFVDVALYKRYRKKVDAELKKRGLEVVIVAE